MVGRGAADATVRAVWLELRARRLGVEYLTDIDTAGNEVSSRGRDVGDYQVEAVDRARDGRRNIRPELHRTGRP